MRPVRVLLADDHPTFRRGLGALLATVDEAELVGEAATGEEVLALVPQLLPDVVVMDLHMPGVDGLEATRRLTATHPGTAVLVLTMLEDDESVFAAMRSGARGYVVKGADTDDVVRALLSVARGDVVFGPAVAARVLGFLTRPLSARHEVLFPELSAREREVLALIAGGSPNSQIARQLFLSPKTVRNHVSSIFAKLQVADRSDAIVRARQAGLVPDRDVPRPTRDDPRGRA